MDLSKLVGQQLLKISQSTETGQHIIEFTQPTELEQQIIEVDPTKLETTTVDMGAGKILEVIKIEHSRNQAMVNSLLGGASSSGQQQPAPGFVPEEASDVNMLQNESGGDQEDLYSLIDDKQPILRFNSYAEFKRALNEYESQTITKFILRNQSRQFPSQVCLHDILQNDNKSSDLPLIRWEFCAAKDFLPIPFMGVPYITVGKQVFQCHQGKDYNTNKKQQYELKKEIMNQATRFQIKSRNKGPSKKLDCPVLFAVRKMYFFPEYHLENDSKRNRASMASRIRARLARIKKETCTCQKSENELIPNRNLPGKLEYLTKLPGTSSHNHDVSRAASFMRLQLKKLGSKGVQMMQTKKPSEANPYQYDKHIELITALRSTGDLDQLRTARESMAAVYPLSEELWLEWFQDELPLAVIPEQKEFLLSKFELAVKDYASTKVWHEYCQFVMNNIESPADIDRARSVFERAITAVGLHVTEGASIWDGYREFEIAILDSYRQLQDSGDTVGMDAKVQAQIDRIASIFKRQLSIPLLGMENTFKLYEDWTPEPISEQTTRAYEKATEKLLLCMEFEEKLHESTGTKLDEYKAYIACEIKNGDPARIQCVFERAIKDNCLQHDLWMNYTNYLDFKLKIPSVAVPVHERAVRNCPWVSLLWINYIKAMERNNEDYDKVKEVMSNSLKGGFVAANDYLSVWLANCDYHRRRITDWTIEEDNVEELHKAFEGAITYMNHYFGLEGDKYCVLLREWAFIEAKYLQNVKRAQELWDTVMKKHARDSAIWLEYIQFLMLFSDVLAVRRAFQRCVQISLDTPESVCEAFIKFERQYGTLEDVDDSNLKVESQLKKSKERKEKEAMREQSVSKNPHDKKKKFGKKYDAEEQTSDKKKKKKMKQNEQKQKSRRGKEGGSSLKRNAPSSDMTHTEEPKAKRTKEDGPSLGATPISNDALINVAQPVGAIEKVNSGSGLATSSQQPINPANQNQPQTKSQDNINERLQEMAGEDNSTTEKVDNERSVFLSNLLFTTDEEQIRGLFKQCGSIETVRIIVNRVGKSKGFAYLQFHEKDSVSKALTLDRTNLNGRPVFVSECVDKKENPTKFRFPTTIDKHTLYVSNIAFEVEEDQIKTLFTEASHLKQVRLVTNRSGKSKGYAYVEYENETDAKMALLKFDKHVLHGRPMNVAISNPPARKDPEKKQQIEQNKSHKSKPLEGRGKAKTQISLVPRAVQKPAATVTQSSSTTTPQPSAKNQPATSKTNEDFRKLLLKK